MEKFSLLLSSRNRSLNYLVMLVKNNLKPDFVILYSKEKNKKILKILNVNKIRYVYLRTNQINASIVEREIIKTKNKIFIFSGYGAQIIKSKKILNKIILHAHPGSLYDFKGSTTMYYSLLLKKKITCSILRLNKKIDSGVIYFRQKFILPKNIKIKKFENDFDNNVRILTIIKYLKLCKGKKIKPLFKKKYKKTHKSTYYICHPILRGLAFNKNFS